MVIWQKKVDKLREKSTAEIQTKFDNGDFDQGQLHISIMTFTLEIHQMMRPHIHLCKIGTVNLHFKFNTAIAVPF